MKHHAQKHMLILAVEKLSINKTSNDSSSVSDFSYNTISSEDNSSHSKAGLLGPKQDPKRLTRQVKRRSLTHSMICNYDGFMVTYEVLKYCNMACCCSTQFYCLQHKVDSVHLEPASQAAPFSTKQQVQLRDMDMTLSPKELHYWAEKEEIQLGNLVLGECEKIDVHRLLYTYRDLGATDMMDLPVTDLIQH
jgi:hypothetical protein